MVQTKSGAWKLLGKLIEEELKEKDFSKIKALKPDKVSSSSDQKLEAIEHDIEELKMMKYHLSSIDKTLSNILA